MSSEIEPVAWLGSHGVVTTSEVVANAWEESFPIAITPLFTNPSSIRNAALDEAADKLEAIMEDRRSRKITRGHDYIASCASTIRMLKDQS